MSLPHTREATYVANDVAGGSILMAIQHWCNRFFSRFSRKTKSIALSCFQQNTVNNRFVTFANGAATMYTQATAASQIQVFDLRLRPGDIITAIKIFYWKGGASNMTFNLKRFPITAEGVTATVASQALTAAAGSWQNTTLVPGSPGHVVDGAYAYYCELVAAQSGDRASCIVVSFRHG